MEEIDATNLPKHIAITMDGNGRWAKSKGKLRIFGHKNGVKAVRDTVEGAAEIGIKYLTLYAFSSENWNRPEKEVNALMTLLVSAINKETKTLMDNNIRLSTIGDINKLPSKAQKELQEAISKTKDNTRMTLVLALSYSGRGEILIAVKNIIKDGKEPEEINEATFQQYLTTKSVPDPELLIRTSGEYRISNFLLWQIAYSELYFTDTLWPDFRKADLYKAILNYQTRERRFGKTTEQLQK
ncbi:MAG: Ditrans,polycis-undecaprenyl-diphosphate synthase ((2E,6E)-farnesyl-diphosphate specific) [Cryomorphaceae bacterium]|nr:MAG: Ditrans,polycis-undecaprenyl-diphosphate synthase ((2E,6E)-farnesyl-diphosphate specific) [Cryomorphaceae bacterium]